MRTNVAPVPTPAARPLATRRTLARRTLRPLTRRALAPLALVVALVAGLLGVATPAQAAGYLNEGTYSMNTYYGAASGWGYITSDLRSFTVSGYTRDVRNDGYCAVSQARALVNGTAVTGWYKVSATCSTTTSAYGSSPWVTASRQVNQIQVRSCQADRNGVAIGTCSAPVYVSGWRTIAY